MLGGRRASGGVGGVCNERVTGVCVWGRRTHKGVRGMRKGRRERKKEREKDRMEGEWGNFRGAAERRRRREGGRERRVST